PPGGVDAGRSAHTAGQRHLEALGPVGANTIDMAVVAADHDGAVSRDGRGRADVAAGAEAKALGAVGREGDQLSEVVADVDRAVIGDGGRASDARARGDLPGD